MSETPPSVSWRTFVVGVALLTLSGASSLLLALDHLGSLELPGCGVESACRRASASAWASVPGLGWPTAFIGCAYFVGVLAAWILSRKNLAALFQLVASLGGIVSASFLLLMLVERFVCGYCLAVHLGNLGFWALVHGQPVDPGGSRRVVLTFLVTSVVTAAGLVAAQWRHGERALVRWIDEVAPRLAGLPLPEGEDLGRRGGIAGRYRWGPPRAPIRLVLFRDGSGSGATPRWV